MSDAQERDKLREAVSEAKKLFVRATTPTGKSGEELCLMLERFDADCKDWLSRHGGEDE